MTRRALARRALGQSRLVCAATEPLDLAAGRADVVDLDIEVDADVRVT